MVMPRFKIPSFEEILNKIRQPKAPPAPKVQDFDEAGAKPLGYNLLPGWKLRRAEGQDDLLLSPRGETFKATPIKPLQGFDKYGKEFPIVWPPKLPPPPEPVSPISPESKSKDLWDAFRLGGARSWEDTRNFFTTTLPQMSLKFSPGLKTPTAASGMTATQQQFFNPTEKKSQSDIQSEMMALQQKFESNKASFEKWQVEHPELQPRPEWAGNFKEGMSKDPWGYIGYQIASTAPSVLTGLAAGVIGTVASGGNPLVGAAAASAALTPQVTQQLFEDLKQSGATQDQALTLSATIGPIIGGVEMVGELPLLSALSPAIMQAFRKQIAKETVRLTVAQLAKKGIINATKVELAETAEEVIQQAIQNATVKVVDENRSIGQGLGETAINTAIATLPLSLFGGVASVSEQARVRFKAEIPKTWQAEVAKAQSSGLGQLEAERVAAARIMEMPEGRSITAEIIRSLTGKVPQTAQAISGIEMRLGKQKLDEAIGKGLKPKPSQPAPLHQALIQEGEQLVQQAEKISPQDANLVQFKAAVEAAKTATTTEARVTALREMERIEPEVQKIAAGQMAPSTSVQTGLPGMGKETAQVQMFGEVSGKESRKAPLIEVTKPKKGAEPLPGQMEAFKEAETQGQAIADKAAIEAEVKREMLRSDPVATYRFKMGNRNVGLDSLISIKEQSFPETLTVKQAQALNPEKSFAKYTVKGTKFYNKVPKDAALDQLTKEFNMTPDEIADRVMEIRAEKRAARQAPLTPAPEPTPEEKAVATTFGEAKVFNEKQKAQLIRLIGEYLENPNTDNAWELTRELRRETRAGQAIRLNERTQELLAEGVATEAAMTQAKREIMTGELPKVTTDYFDDVTDTMRVVLFDKVYQVLKDEPFERLSTQDALTNALAGRPIPRELGVKGGSALTRLQRVFGNQPKLLAGIQKMAEEKKPLRDVVEGVFRESGQAPIPIDQATADYLRALPLTQSQQTLGAAIPGEGAVKFVYDPSGKLGLELQGQQIQMGETSRTAYKAHLETSPNANDTRLVFDLDMVNNEIPDDVRDAVLKVFDKEGLDAAFDRLGIEMAQAPNEPKRPDFIDKNVWDTFKEKGMPGFNFHEKKMIVGVLQEIAMSPIDIGNWLRANMSSVDLSGIRTGRMLGSGHPVAFYKSVLSGWKATWSQKEADAHWRAITLDPDYELYERIRKDFGYDPLRVPAKEQEAAFRKSEEFGYPVEERFIPRMGQKLPHIKMSGRGFETLLNDLVWAVWKQQLAMARRYAMKVASRKIKMKPGEAWSIVKEMKEHQGMLGDFVQRASLNIQVGKFRADFTPASPALGGALFAPRAKWARLIVWRHLFSANPRVRAEAWKDISLWIASTAGLVLLGQMLGLWDVETDPVSGQFMSVRIGKTRIDPWEGHRQIVNLYSRLITGQTKSSITGKKTETDVMATLSNFVRSSLNVLPGLITDIKMGKTFTGEKTDITNLEQTARRVLPFSLSQIWETFQENWRLGLVTLPLSVAGESISVYDTAEAVSAEAIAKLGKVDIESREEKVQKAKEAGFTPEKVAEIMASDKAYDMVSLRSDLNKSTSKGAKASPIVADYWTFKEQDDKYAKMSTKEQESYLKANPVYVTDRLFWGEMTEIPDAKTANDLVARAGKYGFDLDTIPAFQKADKTFKIGGKEVKRQVDRIPSDRALWPGYFDYKNLPEDTTQTVKSAYLNDNPDIEAFLVANTDRTTISSLEAAQIASATDIPLNQIPAFSLTDKGKERIPSNRSLWPLFFEYNDLPGTSYLNFTREQVDAGMLPDKYLKEWETYHKLKTDTAKDVFRKGHKEVSKGDWRDEFRRANPEFDKWLQENLDMKPLPPKKTAAVRRGITAPRAASIGGGAGISSARPRGGKPSYPKFKKLKLSMGIGAPKAPKI